MIIVLKPKVSDDEVEHIIKRIKKIDETIRTHISKGEERTIIGVIGQENVLREAPLEMIDGVEKVMPVLKSYKLASRDFQEEDTVIDVDGHKIGGGNFGIIAGPCAVESEEQLYETAVAVKKAGANFLRGGAFKPRTSPYDFQGLQEEGLKILAKVKKEVGLPIVTEVMAIAKVDVVCEYADILQIGARNTQNFDLLKEVGLAKKPILLKRGMSTTINEWLMSAEYIMSQGNNKVILCERGIRTFETIVRNTLDIMASPIIKELTHLPIIIDPSHATGKRSLVLPAARAAVAIGADGLLIEVHRRPEEAKVDGKQSLKPEEFQNVMDSVHNLVGVMNMKIV